MFPIRHNEQTRARKGWEFCWHCLALHHDVAVVAVAVHDILEVFQVSGQPTG